jgi:3-deoxy-D-arabino-heptulosonate 7-phosphate (DAHP) synthase
VEEKRDIKEMKEMIVGVMEMGLMMAELFKDGVQASDFMEMFMRLKDDPRYLEAFKGMKEVPAEAKDLDLQEGMELAMMMMMYVPKYVEAMKKKAA